MSHPRVRVKMALGKARGEVVNACRGRRERLMRPRLMALLSRREFLRTLYAAAARSVRSGKLIVSGTRLAVKERGCVSPW